MVIPPILARAALGVGLLSASACASPPAANPEPADTHSADPAFALPRGFDTRVEDYAASWGRYWPTFRIHGVSQVFAAGRPLFVRAQGMADLAQQTPHTPASRFSIGTLSVHLTHAAVLSLVEAGTVSLDQPVTAFVPDQGLPPTITLEHLLTFSAGLPSFTETLPFRALKTRPASNEAIVATFAGEPLEFDPGTDFAPSLSNAALLGLVIERASKQPYAQYVEQAVLKPLQMHDTRYGRADDTTVGLSFNEAEYLVPDTQTDPRAFGAAGAWTSTSADLGKLYTAVLSGHWGEPLRRRTFGDNGPGLPYGFVPSPVAGRDGYLWLGRIDGHDHAVLLVPEDDLVIVHLGNSEVVPGSDIAMALGYLAYEVVTPRREEAREVPIEVASLAEYAGRWELTASDRALLANSTDDDTAASLQRVVTTFSKTGLSLQVRGRPTKRMHPVAQRRFFFKDRPQSTARVVVRPGGAQELVLEREGSQLRYRRSLGPAGPVIASDARPGRSSKTGRPGRDAGAAVTKSAPPPGRTPQNTATDEPRR